MSRTTILAFVAGCCCLTSHLAAQVGYLPAASPFRDIRTDRTIDLTVGQIMGGGGPIRVGPRDGAMYGARITFRGNHTLQLSLGGWMANTQRFVVDANDSIATRVKAPVPNHLLAGEFTIGFNMTGGKSWHRLAPFASAGIGLVRGQKTPASDTSGYSFGTKFYYVPAIGTRYILTDRLALRLEAKAFFWSLRYPATYSAEPSKQPGTLEHSNAVNTTGSLKGYVLAPALSAGLSIVF